MDNFYETEAEKGYQLQKLTDIVNQTKEILDLPSCLFEFNYYWHSFGTWWVVIWYKNTKFRILYDGKESEYSLEHSLDVNAESWVEIWKGPKESNWTKEVISEIKSFQPAL